jgi:hypothetical protein
MRFALASGQTVRIRPFLEQVATTIGGFGFVFDGVGQRGLADLAREIRALRCPVPQTRAEPVGCYFHAHPAQNHQEHHVGHWPAVNAAGEHEFGAAVDLLRPRQDFQGPRG